MESSEPINMKFTPLDEITDRGVVPVRVTLADGSVVYMEVDRFMLSDVGDKTRGDENGII